MSIRPMILLLWLRLRGNLRQRKKELRGWRGMVSIASILLFTVALIMSMGDLFDASFVQKISNDRLTFAGILPIGVVLAVASSVLFSSGPALHFAQSEVNLLWTAPVTRVWLILLKIFSYSGGAIVTSVLMVSILPGETGTRAVRLIAIFLTLMFVQVCTTSLRMCVSSITNRYFTFTLPSTALLKIGVLATIAVGVLIFIPEIQDLLPTVPLPGAVLAGLNVLMLPFSTVASLMLHSQFSHDFAADSFAVCAMIILCICIIVLLDRQLNQQMLEDSAKASRRWSRALQSGILSERSYTTSSSSRPRARLGGAGPIIWSRWLYATRSSGHTLIALIFVAGTVGLIAGTQAQNFPAAHLAAAAFFVSLYMLPRVLVFDFRNSPQLMETLQGLPVPALRICIAQISVSVIWKTAIEATAITGFLVTSGKLTFSLWLVALGAVTLLNIIATGIDNLLFLLHPKRLLPVGRLDFDFLGRTLFEFLSKSVVLIAVGILAFYTALLAVNSFHNTYLVFVVVFLGVLLVSSICILLCISRAYSAVDVSKFDRL